jgi:hypothetical protein
MWAVDCGLRNPAASSANAKDIQNAAAAAVTVFSVQCLDDALVSQNWAADKDGNGPPAFGSARKIVGTPRPGCNAGGDMTCTSCNLRHLLLWHSDILIILDK